MDGGFSYSYIPTGIYAEIRSLSNLRFQTQEEIIRLKNRIARWFSIYFPEYKDVYRDFKAVSGFIAEVGDIGRFDNPKQLQKLAGYAIVSNDSGKHNGESRISYRGRKRLRYTLYEAAISLIGKNAEFRENHEYYRAR